MNREKLEEKLNRMSGNDFKVFIKKFGGDYTKPSQLIRNYIDHPEWEPRLCQLLNLPTEDERKTQAAISASKSAKYAAIAAAISILISLAALIISLIK